MSDAVTGWRVSAGDDLTVFDGRNCKIVSVESGGLSGRRYNEAAQVAALIAAAPKLLAALEDLAQVADDQLDGEFPELMGDVYRAIAAAKVGA